MYDQLTLIIESSGDQFHWTVLGPVSGKPSYYSVMYDDIKLAIDSAKAHIYNMNNLGVVIGRWDNRIKPYSITDEHTPIYEYYFRNILKTIDHTVEEYTPEPEPEHTPPKRGHLSLV